MNLDTLLCRAKDIDGNWIVGYYAMIGEGEQAVHYIIQNGFLSHIFKKDEDNMYFIDVEIDLSTLCRCTGIKDINGKLIFEKDMLDAPYNIVSFCSNLQDGLGMNSGFYLQRDNFESWRELECREDYKIIGNILDNPELINNYKNK